MMSEQTVLIADDDTAIRTVLVQAITRLGLKVRSTGNVATLWAGLPTEKAISSSPTS